MEHRDIPSYMSDSDWVFLLLDFVLTLCRRLVFMCVSTTSCVHDPLSTISNEEIFFKTSEIFWNVHLTKCFSDIENEVFNHTIGGGGVTRREMISQTSDMLTCGLFIPIQIVDNPQLLQISKRIRNNIIFKFAYQTCVHDNVFTVYLSRTLSLLSSSKRTI